MPTPAEKKSKKIALTRIVLAKILMRIFDKTIEENGGVLEALYWEKITVVERRAWLAVAGEAIAKLVPTRQGPALCLCGCSKGSHRSQELEGCDNHVRWAP